MVRTTGTVRVKIPMYINVRQRCWGNLRMTPARPIGTYLFGKNVKTVAKFFCFSGTSKGGCTGGLLFHRSPFTIATSAQDKLSTILR